jgi:hypothetical protein
MIGEVVVWPGFTSTSTNLNVVLRRFVKGQDPLLFEIHLHPGDAAVAIGQYSAHRAESEVLIAASTGFVIDDLDSVSAQRLGSTRSGDLPIPRVKLCYFIPWYDLDIDHPPGIGIV